ncbi:hypothetical protein [Micromonospora sp. NPDC005806]|uniref:hypothetical protein n=1 Tax=Micromonospora sp. NPDC005806 TaxID=3364234 RepID=UPI00369AA751
MNEITLLRTYGPDAPEAPPETLDAARGRLAAEFATPPSQRSGVPARRRTLLVAAAATLVAAAGATAVGLGGGSGGVRPGGQPAGTPDVVLAAMKTPEFPVALRPRPATLAAPTLSYEPGRFLAVYLGHDGVSDVYLSVYDHEPPDGGVASRRVAVGGRPAELYDVRLPGSPHTVEVMWERAPGQWMSLVGNGRLASEAAVLRLAASVVDQPQPVPLRVRLAPRGWTLASFKDDTILTLRGDSPDETLSVQVVERRDPDLFHQVMGAQEERPVRVGGRDGRLIRASEFWFLQTEVPGGAVVNLQAPLRLTADQVVAIAEQVSMARTR